MKIIHLKDISLKTSTRESGLLVALFLFEFLSSSEMTDFRTEALPDGTVQVSITPVADEVVIDISQQSNVSTGFIDEVIYRLAEQDQLRHFRFQIHDEHTYKKLVSASDHHKVPIAIIYNSESKTIKPSEKPTKKEANVVVKDL